MNRNTEGNSFPWLRLILPLVAIPVLGIVAIRVIGVYLEGQYVEDTSDVDLLEMIPVLEEDIVGQSEEVHSHEGLTEWTTLYDGTVICKECLGEDRIHYYFDDFTLMFDLTITYTPVGDVEEATIYWGDGYTIQDTLDGNIQLYGCSATDLLSNAVPVLNPVYFILREDFLDPVDASKSMGDYVSELVYQLGWEHQDGGIVPDIKLDNVDAWDIFTLSKVLGTPYSATGFTFGAEGGTASVYTWKLVGDMFLTVDSNNQTVTIK